MSKRKASSATAAAEPAAVRAKGSTEEEVIAFVDVVKRAVQVWEELESGTTLEVEHVWRWIKDTQIPLVVLKHLTSKVYGSSSAVIESREEYGRLLAALTIKSRLESADPTAQPAAVASLEQWLADASIMSQQGLAKTTLLQLYDNQHRGSVEIEKLLPSNNRSLKVTAALLLDDTTVYDLQVAQLKTAIITVCSQKYEPTIRTRIEQTRTPVLQKRTGPYTRHLKIPTVSISPALTKLGSYYTDAKSNGGKRLVLKLIFMQWINEDFDLASDCITTKKGKGGPRVIFEGLTVLYNLVLSQLKINATLRIDFKAWALELFPKYGSKIVSTTTRGPRNRDQVWKVVPREASLKEALGPFFVGAEKDETEEGDS